MLVDAKDHRIRNDIESEPEVRVPPTIGEGIDLDDFAAWKGSVYDPLQQGRGQLTTRLGPNPAGLVGSTRKHRCIIALYART